MHNVEEVISEIKEVLSEEEPINEGTHRRLDHIALYIRNIATFAAMLMFLYSVFHLPYYNIVKGIAYFIGAGAYLCEILVLTDFFSTEVPHREMFMAYCFGPIYILMGLSYIL